ncbi:hypothetical protein IE077_003506 [Cardiosporidium cionae]|uniref:Uncharacterized protein n=1 Tax=Cardiosporidium cionae TaxID=476202 RepID=A0ABQ7JEV9_9APIC|nr:hypothetical protein IE077_003506 [Cardiosporidium cionae]|eukprot:KAF8822547.1 hypothetical protein IE077_003506 [Cardiosporidium cionae]
MMDGLVFSVRGMLLDGPREPEFFVHHNGPVDSSPERASRLILSHAISSESSSKHWKMLKRYSSLARLINACVFAVTEKSCLVRNVQEVLILNMRIMSGGR